MKKLIIGNSLVMNRYWSLLENQAQAIWLVKNRSKRRLIELQKPGMDVIDLPGLCQTVITASGLAQFKLMDDWQQLAMLRSALADSRCTRITTLQQAMEFSGGQKRLLGRIQRMISARFSPEDQEASPDSDGFAVIRQVYEQFQMDANLWDEHLVLSKFIEFLEEPELVESIKNWAFSFKTGTGGNKTLVIPRAEKFTGIEQTIILFLCDFVDSLQVGIEKQKYSTNENTLKSSEIWFAATRDFENEVLQDWENSFDAKHNHFNNMATEKQAVSSILLKMGEEKPGRRVVVYVPGEQEEAEQYTSALRQAGIKCTGAIPRLIEKPEVRAVLDMVIGLSDDWPTIQIVDLLRNSSFQFESIDSELSRREVDRLAGEIYRLGEVNGISEILKSLQIKWDESKRFRVAVPSEKQQLKSMNLLSEIKKCSNDLDQTRLWPDWVGWLQGFVSKLLGIEFKNRLNDFWHVLNAYSEMELAIGQKEWLFKEVLGEIQLLLEQAEATNVDGNAAEVILYQDKLPDFSVVGDWVCCGMNEKYYPSRTRLREGLRSQSDLSLLWENEQNEFAGLCGLAFSRVVFTSSKINFKGDELNPSGLLDTIEKDIWKADEWQIKQAPGKLLSKEASRFFTRGVTVFNNRKNRDSRYLGLVCSDSAKNRLVEYFNSNYGFSSTSLESAALCPFQFFAEQVLKIEKNEVNDDIGTNYLVEGNVIHAILEDIHKCLPLIDTLALNEISKLLGEKLDEYFQPSERVKESNFALARWRIQRRRIEQKLSGYAEQLAKQLVADQKKNDQPVRVIGVELNTRAGNIRIDPLVFLDEKTGLETRIHGRIDRVDQLSDGEQAKIRIIDYKSGNRINAAEIEGRLHLQLPLYAMMLDGFKLKDSATGKDIELSVSDIGFWYLKKTIGGYKTILKSDFNINQITQEYKNIVLEIVRKIRGGEFNINPKVPKCDEKCEMHEVCRIREIRIHPEMKL